MRTTDTGGSRAPRSNETPATQAGSSSVRRISPSRGRDRLHLSLRQAVQDIVNAGSMDSVVRQLLSTIQSVFHCDVSLVYVIEEDERRLIPHVNIRTLQDTEWLSDNPRSQQAVTEEVFPEIRIADCCQRLQLSPFRWPSNEGRPARKCAMFDTLHDVGFSTWFSIPLSAGKQTVGFVAVGYFHYQYLLDDAGQILWEFAQDVTRALLPHLPANIRETQIESQEVADLPSLYQQDRMRRLLANHHELTNTLWADDKLPAIMESLSFIVHQPVALLDSYFYPLTTYPADAWHDLLPAVQQWMTHRHNTSHIRLPLSVRTDRLGEETFVITPVQMGSTVLGYLVVWERGARLDDLDVMALQQSTTILAVHFYKHGLHIERLGHGFAELFSTLLDSPESWDDSHTAQAIDIGWDVQAAQCILVGKPVSEEMASPSHENLQEYLGQLRLRFAVDYPTVLVTRHQNHFVFAVPESQTNDESLSRLIQWIHSIDSNARMMASTTGTASESGAHGGQRLVLSFGVSGITRSPAEIADAYKEAATAAALAPLVGSNRLFVRADDVRIYLLLQPVASLTATQRFMFEQLEPLEAYDGNHQTELIKTLRTYLQFNGNLTDTARALFIHRTSLQYRLTRMAGLLNRNLEDAQTRMELQLALIFRELEDLISGT